MKTRKLSFLLLLATALSATVLSKASKNEPATAYPTLSITLHSSYGDDHVTLGDSREKVRLLMDCPSRELTRDVWLYHGFFANSKQANEQGCRSIIITFADDKVVDLKLVNKSAAVAIAANLKLSPAFRNVASTNTPSR
jgi:hypothetical protein